MERYNFKSVESKWQNFWEKNSTFKTEVDKNKKKFYCLERFPYPSGKIHMWPVRNYTIGDVLLDINYFKDLMYYILWGGTLLECLQKMLLKQII